MIKSIFVVLVIVFTVNSAWAVPRLRHPRKLTTPCESGTWATRGQYMHVCMSDQKWHKIYGDFNYVMTFNTSGKPEPFLPYIMTPDKIFVTCKGKSLPTPDDAVGRVDLQSMHYGYLPQLKDKYLICE